MGCRMVSMSLTTSAPVVAIKVPLAPMKVRVVQSSCSGEGAPDPIDRVPHLAIAS